MNKRDIKRLDNINRLTEAKKSEDNISFLNRLCLIDLQIRDELK